ncbi:MAG: hypothetical protein ACLPKB_32845 [Xanthobacteraceae bacterium]
MTDSEWRKRYRPKPEPALLPARKLPRNLIMYAGSMSLCGFAAWFSVEGLVEIFAAHPDKTLAMALTMEGVKFVGVSWLTSNWRALWWGWRYTVAAMLLTMACITFAGDHVYLNRAADLDKHEAARNDIATPSPLLWATAPPSPI